MVYEMFIKKVQEYSGLESRDDAIKVTKATLETMRDRLPRTHKEHLEAQLPTELKQYLSENVRTEYFNLEDFYHRVGNRADIGFQNAVKYSKAVARVLTETVAQGELEDILSGFPHEYRELFGEKPSSPLSPSTVGE